VNVAGQPVELRDDDGSLGLAGAVDSGVERRPVIVSPGFVLPERIQEAEAFRLGDLGKRRLLRFKPETRTPLLRRRDWIRSIRSFPT
jgi:hypothetical protein